MQDPAPAATSTPEKPLSVSKLSLAEAAVQVASGLDKRLLTTALLDSVLDNRLLLPNCTNVEMPTLQLLFFGDATLATALD